MKARLQNEKKYFIQPMKKWAKKKQIWLSAQKQG